MISLTPGENHKLHALTENGERAYDGMLYDWHAAIAAWFVADDARREGKRPHVRYYAVRADNDPDWIDSEKSPVHFEDARIADRVLTDYEYAVIINSLTAMRDRCLVSGVDLVNIKSALAKLTRGCTLSTYGIAFTLIERS